MKKIVLPILTVAALAVTATTAAAGCNPKCGSDQKCRYSGASGKYYCAPINGFQMGGITKMPGASGGFGGSKFKTLQMGR